MDAKPSVTYYTCLRRALGQAVPRPLESAHLGRHRHLVGVDEAELHDAGVEGAQLLRGDDPHSGPIVQAGLLLLVVVVNLQHHVRVEVLSADGQPGFLNTHHM